MRPHRAQLSLYAGLLGQPRRHEERIGELEQAQTRLSDELRPLSIRARAVPYTAGEPFEIFEHPIAGTVQGFREPPVAAGPSERYRLFEDVFRGSRGRVAGLVEPYVALLQGHGPVLDIGCGRGELLEALGAAGLEATGVDTDEGMAAEARARGLDVTVGDALEHLRGMPEASLGAITAIHVVEHLEPGYLVELMALATTRLRPGGLFVAETSNPHAPFALKTFWVDLTHQHPIFPEVALVLAAAAGFGSGFVMYPRGQGLHERDRFTQDAYALVAGT